MSEIGWKQASLPPTSGGLGIRSLSTMAHALFLSASASVSELAKTLSGGSPDAVLPRAIAQWRERTQNTKPPQGNQSKKLSYWMRPIENQVLQELRAQAAPRDIARILSASTTESASLFNCLPSSREGTRLHDSALSCAVGLRLGSEVAAASTCVCGSQLDTRGDHALTCRHGAGRHARHSEVNARIQRAL